MTEHTIATVDEVPPGEGIGVEVDGLEVAVYNLDGEFYAISNRCPHKKGSLCEAGEPKLNFEDCTGPTRGRLDADGLSVYCPLHWWEFDLETGESQVTGMRVRTFDVGVVDGEIRLSI